ncbi:MAG TPA: response regulator [Nitrospiraceae bacterium]|nr:response regulator [Nitrospiraceae bacterium]
MIHDERVPVHRASEQKTILIVDDEAKMRQILRVGLIPHGFNILDVENSQDALRLCKEYPGPIHLLLVDVVMPEMNGLELAPRIKALRPEVQVILMSGHKDDQILLHASLNPNTPFFHKPFTLDALVRTIQDVLKVTA